MQSISRLQQLHQQFTSQNNQKRNVVIVACKRTPIGSFQGSLSQLEATELGAIAIEGALKQCGVAAQDVEELIMGNVISAGLGQNPTKQCARKLKMSLQVSCTTVNKVCASGLKSVMLAAQQISCGDRNIVVAGGMESMSNIPHYVQMRQGKSFGHSSLVDGLVKDGLTDVEKQVPMGTCTDNLLQQLKITREEQDNYAIESYERARKAQQDGLFDFEITEVSLQKGKKKLNVKQDEECKKFLKDKFKQLTPAFTKQGTITAGNASKLNDGAAAFVLMSEEEAIRRGLKPLAKIIAYEDGGVEPENFGAAPIQAVKRTLKKANMDVSQIDYHEINEAFSGVALASMKEFNLRHDQVNVNGGAVALGHPLGMSGSRILISLINVLKQKKGNYGMASICNGGGGASAVLIQNIQ